MKESDIGPITGRRTVWEAVLYVFGQDEGCQTVATGQLFPSSNEALWAAHDAATVYSACLGGLLRIEFGARSIAGPCPPSARIK